MTEDKSEFGKGLVICLVKFAEHYDRLGSTLESWAKYRETNPDLFSEGDAVESHFNAASDHLYEIEVPKEWVKKYPQLCEMVKKLQNTTLKLGHGFPKEKATKEEAYELHQLSRDIALEIDKILGLTPDIGSW